jgi:hypothetical protein
MVSYSEYIEELRNIIPIMSDEDLKSNLEYFRSQLFTDGIALIEIELKKRTSTKK